MRIEIEVDGPIFEFESFAAWVNKAQRMFENAGLTGSSNFLSVDAMGRVCRRGRDFARARDDEAFPVRVYLLDS